MNELSCYENEDNQTNDTKELSENSKNGDISLRNRSMFCGYANVLRIVLAKWTSIFKELHTELKKRKLDDQEEDFILPSNEDWRHRVYYILVELQREYDAELATKRAVQAGLELEFANEMMTERKAEEKRDSYEWEPKNCGCVLRAKETVCQREDFNGSVISVRCIVGSMTEACVQPGWYIDDILLAARVLQKDPVRPTYSDEVQMRRVFGLVYDVFRYKKIFCHVLEDVGFWGRNSALKDREKVVWLLLYDMQGRKFARRGEVADVEDREKIFEVAGLMDIESALLEVKTHLAASISRLRIRGSALSLDELLPTRLRIIKGVAWGGEAAIASGWVNAKKFVDKQEFLEEMSKLNLSIRANEVATELEKTDYAFDSICPKVVNLHENARGTLAVSTLVRDHRFVFLERSLCLGAAALARAIRLGRFCGPVVLTHSLAPRHTGYLAELLDDIENAGRLLAFGAGDRRCEYETYLKDLGVTLQRCRVFSEKYVSPPATAELERATVVLAIPPCSYTGVKDIVDLAVARGGDVDLLESLTDCCTNDDKRNHDREVEELRKLLIDQMSTLKYALTRPNVQFLIYEVHTVLPSETTEMVEQVVDYANRMAMEKHIRDYLAKKSSKEGKESSKQSKLEKTNDPGEENDVLSISAKVTVPDSDLFEVSSIDVIYGKNASSMVDPGCFLAVIRRKEMMQFDSLFMIKVAESKGLFGDTEEQRQTKPLLIHRSPQRSSRVVPRKRAKCSQIEIDRLMTHTHSSLMRATKENQVCPRHKRCDAWRDDFIVTQVSKSFNGDDKLSKLRSQEESVNRLSAPVRPKSSQKKDLRAIHSFYSSKISSPRSETDAFPLRATSKRKKKPSSTLLTSFLTVQPLTRHQWKDTVSSSTVLRSPILARALRPILLENDTELQDEDAYQQQSYVQAEIPRKVSSRLLRPGGSIEHARFSAHFPSTLFTTHGDFYRHLSSDF